MVKEKKKLSANVICFIIAGAIALCFFGVKAGASTLTDDLNSKGVVRYEEGSNEVVIDSSDFYTLAAQIELLNAKIGN